MSSAEMGAPEVDQTQVLLHPQEKNVECRNERQVIHDFNQLKSFDIMKLAFKICTSNTKLMFLMMFSTIPFFVFMVFCDLKLQKAIVSGTSVLRDLSPFELCKMSHSVTRNAKIDYGINDNNQVQFLYDFLQLCLLYLVLYPLVELPSMITTIQIAAKAYAGENPSNLEEVFYRNSSYLGFLITYGHVHLRSFLTLLSLSLIGAINMIFICNFDFSCYDFWSFDIGLCLFIVFLGMHTMFFLAVLYKYISWSAFWNMAMVISGLEEETELDAFGMSYNYGRNFKATGFQLMIGFLAFNVVLRLLCLYGGLSKLGVVEVTSLAIGFVCLGNLVKWVAFVLYYFGCKQQTVEKKDGEEFDKAVTNV